jgi:hypothetical protein
MRITLNTWALNDAIKESLGRKENFGENGETHQSESKSTIGSILY